MSDAAPEFVQRGPYAQNTDELARLVTELDERELQIKDVGAYLLKLTERRKSLVERLIPDAMDKIGTNVFGIPGTDRECRIKPFYHAVLPDRIKEPELHAEGLAWLLENHGDSVRHSLTLEFNREDHERASRVAARINQMLAEEGVSTDTTVQKSFGVHWKTLTSLVKELTEEGKPFPQAALGARIGRTAQLVQRKVK